MQIEQDFKLDTHEPIELITLLKPAVPLTVAPLNEMGRADFYYVDANSKSHQTERKTIVQIATDMSDIEEQITRELPHADYTYLLIENVIHGLDGGYECFKYIDTGKQRLFVPNFRNKKSPGRLTAIYSWTRSLERQGVGIIWSSSIISTAIIMAARFHNDQKPDTEHETLQRYIKPKPAVFHPNPHVRSLMGLEGVDIGPKRAISAIKAYKTIWAVMNCSKEELYELDGWGEKLIDNFFKAIGRK